MEKKKNHASIKRPLLRDSNPPPGEPSLSPQAALVTGVADRAPRFGPGMNPWLLALLQLHRWVRGARMSESGKGGELVQLCHRLSSSTVYYPTSQTNSVYLVTPGFQHPWGSWGRRAPG